MDDLIKKLRDFPKFYSMDGAHWLWGMDKEPTCIAAADEIERLQMVNAQQAMLIESLKYKLEVANDNQKET